MANIARDLFNSHVILRQPVVAGGELMSLDIFQHTPVALEEIHPHLCFLTPVHNKKRTAMNGQWKRTGTQRAVYNNNNIKIGIQMRYEFKWEQGLQPRPVYRMTEYVKSMYGKKGICIIQREQAENVEQEQQEGQQQEGQQQQQQEGQQQGQ
ncbi:unnamed protein product [Arabidopsis arenosa]|uniref:Uncharacterized protein n=1 Tax=Arabidopsis arenosa TaxID=38785 RepID=A0A8S1ZQT8_ARAAE|nr:unnamed protein product [Arabidopsis arenosa]